MSISKTIAARLAALALSALCLYAPSRAFAQHVWRPQGERRAQLIGVANHYGYDMGVSSDHTARHLNDSLKPESRIPKEAIRITDYATWERAAREFGPMVIGGAATPHEGGPHLYLVAGEKLADTIDPESPDTFYDTHTKTRAQWIGNAYHYPRIFLLWNAPAAALASVGLEAERIVRDRGSHGYNCGILMAKTLAKEGEHVPTSPFHGRMRELSNLPWPRAEAALRAVSRVGPDMVIQVVQREDLDNIRGRWDSHGIVTQF